VKKQLLVFLFSMGLIAWSGQSSAQGSVITQPPSVDAPLERDIAQVRIVRRGSAIHREYHYQGRLYMIQVIPQWGPSYYLVDTNGDGILEPGMPAPWQSGLWVPNWILYRW